MTATLPAPTFAKARGGRKVKNNLATVLVALAFGLALIPLVWLLWTVISKGAKVIFHADWWTTDQSGIANDVAGGGVFHAIVGTAEQVAICTIISVPVAVLVGVYLVEYGRGPLARITTFMVDIMTGIPSIVAALFIYALFVTTLGGNRAGWLVSLALVILMIPVIVRTTEDVLRLQPVALREASVALGAPVWRTILAVIWKSAQGGMLTGALLAFARISGETAPLLFTALNNQFLSLNLAKPTANLPVVIFQFALSAYDDWRRLAWAGALLIAGAVLTVTVIARITTREPKRS